MFKFERGLRSHFKTEKAFLADVYKRNRDIISRVGYSKKAFINRVIAGKKYSPSAKDGKSVTVILALKDLGNANAFTPYKERAYDNVLSALKHYNKYLEFRNLTKDEHGKYTKIDLSKFKYEDGVYIYSGSVIINIKNSPEDVLIYRINK